MAKIFAKYLYFPDKGEWIWVVYSEDMLGNKEVLTVGVELSKLEIENWCGLAKRNKPWLPNGKPAPDYADKSKIKPN